MFFENSKNAKRLQKRYVLLLFYSKEMGNVNTYQDLTDDEHRPESKKPTNSSVYNIKVEILFFKYRSVGHVLIMSGPCTTFTVTPGQFCYFMV